MIVQKFTIIKNSVIFSLLSFTCPNSGGCQKKAPIYKCSVQVCIICDIQMLASNVSNKQLCLCLEKSPIKTFVP